MWHKTHPHLAWETDLETTNQKKKSIDWFNFNKAPFNYKGERPNLL